MTLKRTRERFQSGSLRKADRRVGWVWEYRYRDHSQPGSPQRQITLQPALYPTETKAIAAVQALVLKLNGSETYTQKKQATMATLVDRYIESERLIEVKALRPGDDPIEGAVQFSTACSYLTTLNRYIKPRWGDIAIVEVIAAAVDEWIRSLTRLPKTGESLDVTPSLLSAKTRGHIKAMLHRLLEKAMFWELVLVARKPIALVEIKGVSKRQKRPFILSVGQYLVLIAEIPEPYRLMVEVAMCLGLRVNEVLALKWADFDFDGLMLFVTRGVVHGRVNKVKTEYSEDELPLDPLFAALLLEWRRRCPSSEADWVFPNPNTGKTYHASTIQQDYIRAAGRRIGYLGPLVGILPSHLPVSVGRGWSAGRRPAEADASCTSGNHDERVR